MLRAITCEQVYWRVISTYADNATVLMSNEKDIELSSNTVEYQTEVANIYNVPVIYYSLTVLLRSYRVKRESLLHLLSERTNSDVQALDLLSTCYERWDAYVMVIQAQS